jgi:hypothetical protein
MSFASAGVVARPSGQAGRNGLRIVHDGNAVNGFRDHRCGRGDVRGDVHKSAQQPLFAAGNRLDRRRRDALHCHDLVHLGGEETVPTEQPTGCVQDRLPRRLGVFLTSRLVPPDCLLRPFSFAITPLPSSQLLSRVLPRLLSRWFSSSRYVPLQIQPCMSGGQNTYAAPQ